MDKKKNKLIVEYDEKAGMIRITVNGEKYAHNLVLTVEALMESLLPIESDINDFLELEAKARAIPL